MSVTGNESRHDRQMPNAMYLPPRWQHFVAGSILVASLASESAIHDLDQAFLEVPVSMFTPADSHAAECQYNNSEGDNLARSIDRPGQLTHAEGYALFENSNESPVLATKNYDQQEYELILNNLHKNRNYTFNISDTVNIDTHAEPSSSATGPHRYNEQKIRRENLIISLEHIHQILYEYPEQLLETLNIQEVIISNEQEYAGRYILSLENRDVSASDLTSQGDGSGIEISLFWILQQPRFNFYEDDNALRRVIAHEIGHAIHDTYCQQGSFYDDPGFAQEIPFLIDGEELVDLTTANDHAGMQRTYVNEYGARNVAEHFATIIGYTISQRGIIQPDDVDYGSPLQHAQERALLRAELVYPGFIAFAEEITHNINQYGLPIKNRNLDILAESEKLFSDTILTRE